MMLPLHKNCHCKNPVVYLWRISLAKHFPMTFKILL